MDHYHLVIIEKATKSLIKRYKKKIKTLKDSLNQHRAEFVKSSTIGPFESKTNPEPTNSNKTHPLQTIS